jgi:isopenicillin N synthase-like dioxygenase
MQKRMATPQINSPHAQGSTTFTEARQGAAEYLQSRLASKAPVTDEEFEVPVIDILPSFSSSVADRETVADQIRKACTTSGFFYITNHGVPQTACDGILRQAERFMHDLSPKQKEELHIKRGKLGLGWEPSEYTSIAGDIETKEVFNFAYETAFDRTGGDGKYKNLDGSSEGANVWPKEEGLPGFYEGIKDYYGAVSRI